MRKPALIFLCASSVFAAEWSAPVDVLHEMKPCVTYRARLEGDNLVVQASLQPGWHTFTMDNKRRAAETLAGKPSLGIDQPTQIKLSKGLAVEGGWNQSQPKDFSKPELRWFSWGFEGQAIFVAKVRRSGQGPAQIEIRGQACTETTCKNIDVALSVPLAGSDQGGGTTNLKTLIPVQ